MFSLPELTMSPPVLVALRLPAVMAPRFSVVCSITVNVPPATLPLT